MLGSPLTHISSLADAIVRMEARPDLTGLDRNVKQVLTLLCRGTAVNMDAGRVFFVLCLSRSMVWLTVKSNDLTDRSPSLRNTQTETLTSGNIAPHTPAMSAVDAAYRAISGSLIGITFLGTAYFAANLWKGYDHLSKKKKDAKAESAP